MLYNAFLAQSTEPMKIVKSLSDNKLSGYSPRPRFFEDYVRSDEFKSVFRAPYETKGIKSLGLSGGVSNQQYDYYSWTDTGVLLGIIGSMQRVDPRLGWMACIFDVDHHQPQTLTIYQAMMLAKPSKVQRWSRAYKTKKALVSDLETGAISWQRWTYDEAINNQWIR